MKKYKKLIIAFLVVPLCILIGASTYMFNVSLKKKVTPTDEVDSYAYLFEHDYMKWWVDSLKANSALKETYIVADDGSKLHALYVKSPKNSPNTALILHGYTDNAIRMLMIGHLYNKELGYNILLPDMRAHGKSDGDYIGMGWKDRLDILRWIDVAKEMNGDSTRIVLHGISMGAATSMMVLGENLPSNIKCIVEDCGYTSVWDEFSHKLKTDYGLPSFPLLYTTSLLCKLKEGWSFKEASSLEQLKKCKLPVFFIHGGADTYVPTSMVNDLYETKQGDKELWIVPHVEHANAYWDHTDEYVEKTRKFVEEYIHNY